eukprot:430138_1
MLFGIFLTLTRIVVVSAHLHQKEINALNDIYFHLNGSQWNCVWDVELINSNNTFIPDQCGSLILKYLDNNINGSQQTVDKIILENDSNIKGIIPSTIGSLNQLTIFIINSVNIHGSIPSTLCNAINLQTLNIVYIPNLFGS